MGKLKATVGVTLCLAVAAVGGAVSVQASSADVNQSASVAHSKFTVIGAHGPIAGVNLWARTNYTAAQVRTDGARMMSYIKNVLHAGAVDIVWNFYAPSYAGNYVEKTSSTLSAANVGILTRIAKQDHLLVEYRPMMFVLNAVNNWEGMIAPSNPRRWFTSYYNANLPYLRMAQKYFVSEYVTGTEMDGVSQGPLYKTFLLSKESKVYHGQLSYADHQYLYFPPKDKFPPTKLLGLDDYMKVNLPASAPLSKVTAAYEHWLAEVPASVLRRTAIDETGIAARAGAYEEPSFMFIPGTYDPAIQANWFTAACRAVKRFHMRAVFFWKVDLADNPAHPTHALSVFEGRPGARAIARCASILRG